MPRQIDEGTLFVATDYSGKQRANGESAIWGIPFRGDSTTPPLSGVLIQAPVSGEVALLSADQLLDELGERIFFASGRGLSAELTRETVWSPRTAAFFALDCAAYAGARLPTGTGRRETLGSALAQAKEWLLSAPARDDDTDFEEPPQTLRRYAVRGLREVGDALDLLFTDDVEVVGEVRPPAPAAAADTSLGGSTLDTAAVQEADWNATESARDAVRAAYEAVRHETFPRRTERENRLFADSFDGDWRSLDPAPEDEYVPAWLSAVRAAEWSRDSVAEWSGDDAVLVARSWQVAALTHYLGGGAPGH